MTTVIKTLLSACLICSCLTSQAVSDVTFNKKRLSPTLELARQDLTTPGILPDITQIRVETRSRPSDGNDSYEITRQDDRITITAPTDLGALYGAYHLARLSASGAHVPSHISESPAFALRILNHWDNLDGTIERGYAGRSMWKWDELPDVMSPRYADYARRNASIGINATVLNNVNASPLILSTPYLSKSAYTKPPRARRGKDYKA